MFTRSVLLGAILLVAPALAVPYGGYGDSSSSVIVDPVTTDAAPTGYDGYGDSSSTTSTYSSSTEVDATGTSSTTCTTSSTTELDVTGTSSTYAAVSSAPYPTGSSTDLSPTGTGASSYYGKSSSSTVRYPLGNSTVIYQPTNSVSSYYATSSEDTTTTITLESTLFLTKTLSVTTSAKVDSVYPNTETAPVGDSASTYPTSSALSPNNGGGKPGNGGGCAPPETVTETTTEKVYITVTPSGSSDLRPTATSSKPLYPTSGYGSHNTTMRGPTGTGGYYPSKSHSVYKPEGYGSSSSTDVKPVDTTAYPSTVVTDEPAPTGYDSSYRRTAAKGHRHGHKAIHRLASANKAQVAPVSGVSKRGVLYEYGGSSNAAAFQGSSCGWAYNWGSDKDGLQGDFEYVPMLWGTRPDDLSSWDGNVQKAIAGGAKAVLGYNEPDHTEQANLSPAVAAQGFKDKITPLAGKVRIGSPAVTNGAAPMGLAWLSSFMGSCSDCAIDFVNIHWYDAASNVQYFKDHVTEAHKTFGKPVWITEFGATGSDAEIDAFLKEVLPWLDSQDFVERYAYFMAKDGLLNSGSSLSSYGSTYAHA